MPIPVPELIRKKRNGTSLDEAEIQTLVSGYTHGHIPDYQMSALLMAIYFNGLDDRELSALTDAMLHSGSVMDHSNIKGTKVDKHSTGGVGDKISICLAPAVAALGVPVPMISGRGLGHTGGTLDKLEAIPGFNVNLSEKASNRLLDKIGLFLIGQTEDLAPADRKLYALRDVTGTVESIPLISSSIMSKKLAEGIDALVLDVKCGRGAFMQNYDRARLLGSTLKKIGELAGKKVRVVLTNMNAPIGLTIGNALETREAIQVLKGGGPADTVELTVELGAEMLLLGKKATSLDDGKKQMRAVLNDGSGLDLFAKCIELQGGDPKVCYSENKLPTARFKMEISSATSGFISEIFPRKVASAALHVGAGRLQKEDQVDHSTGVELLIKPGEKVTQGQPVAILHHNDKGQDRAKVKLENAFVVTDEPPQLEPLVWERM